MKITMKNLFLFQLILCLLQCLMCLRPNIVLILTDDQDFILGGITPMTKTLSLIGNEGATFVNSFVASPICCPSRSTILSGKYPHNHGTYNNSLSGGCNSHTWQQSENETFAAILSKDAGYQTFYAGKYLNEYGKKGAGGVEHVPEGWHNWFGLVGNSVYYNFTLSQNGVAHNYSAGEYLTDVIRDSAVNFLKNRASSSEPFLMVLSPPAPHAPFEPAPRHKGVFKNIKAKRTPNFNTGDNSDKHWLMRMPPLPLSETTVDKLDKVYRDRWETLLSVDEMVEAVVMELKKGSLLDNTFIIFTSDNGFHMGQFSQVYDKRQPYETDIRVPLLIRGPSIKKKSLITEPVVNIDLAPTILKLAGLQVPEYMDGVAIDLDTFDSSAGELTENDIVVEDYGFERQFLIEYRGEANKHSVSGDCPWIYDEAYLYHCYSDFDCKCEDSRNNSYSCVRHIDSTVDLIYCSFNDKQEFEEAYNLVDDPYQMTNIASEMLPAFKYKYRNAIEELMKCKGKSCDYMF